MYYDNHPNAQYMQPSKVVHVRNLPFEISDEEITALCSECGHVVAVKGRVGEKKNQAFVEFADLQAAKNIVNRYQNNAEPARLRGRPVFLSYAGRDFLTNATSTFATPSPVVAVGLTEISGTVAPLLTIEALYAMFSTFGTVVKMAMEAPSSASGSSRVAFVQFADVQSAQRVRSELVGARIPLAAFEAAGAGALAKDTPLPCVASVRFCAQRNLIIPVQSAATRDFTRPELPWGEPNWEYIASLAPAPEAGAPTRVLSITFEHAVHPVTLEGLQTICATYGTVQKIHTYDREGRPVALVQYSDTTAAEAARTALEGHAMYGDGANVMRLVFSRHNDLVIRPGDPRSRDFSRPAEEQSMSDGPNRGGATLPSSAPMQQYTAAYSQAYPPPATAGPYGAYQGYARPSGPAYWPGQAPPYGYGPPRGGQGMYYPGHMQGGGQYQR